MIKERVEDVKRRVKEACERRGRDPSEVLIVAVSKGFGEREIREAFEAGIRDFGENRVQEARSKIPLLNDLPIRWHMVGHLQTNKVNHALRLFEVIHSIDSIRIAEAINKRAERKIPVLIEVNISGEGTKFGFKPEDVFDAYRKLKDLENLEIIGLMGMAPFVENPEDARPFFKKLREIRDKLGLKELSMGMTQDFEVAVEEGATILRIGRAIFGERG